MLMGLTEQNFFLQSVCLYIFLQENIKGWEETGMGLELVGQVLHIAKK